jgi:DNA repair protein RAD50
VSISLVILTKLLNGRHLQCCESMVLVTSHNVYSYVKEKGARRLQECAEKVEQYDIDLRELGNSIEAARDVITKIDKEINESGASVANLRENIRVRKLVRDIAETQAEIDSHDMEEAAKARRNFQDKYNKEKQRENDLHTSVSTDD